MADKGFIDKGKELVPTESPTTKTTPRILKGNLENATVKEALQAYLAQEEGSTRRSEAKVKGLEAMIGKDKKVGNIHNIFLEVYGSMGTEPRKITLAEVKMKELSQKHIKDALAQALIAQEGYFKTLARRKATRDILQPFFKAVAEGINESYFKVSIGTVLGPDLYEDVMRTKIDRSLVTVYKFDHARLSKGYGNVLSNLVDQPADARAFALMVTGGFRPADLESMTLQQMQTAINDDVLEYETKVGKKGRESRYRPVLPEHKAIFGAILADADTTDLDQRAFPQGKDWKKILKNLNTELLNEFGDKFLTVFHPHKNRILRDPVSVSMLRHHMESRLVRVGLTSEQARQDIMGRSKSSADMGIKYAAVNDRIGVGSEAYNLFLRANDVLALEGGPKGAVGLALDWIPGDDDVRSVLFDTPDSLEIDRPIQQNMQLSPSSSITMSVEAYQGQTDELVRHTAYITDEREKVINKLISEYGIPREVILDKDKEYHRFFRNETDVDNKLKAIVDIPFAERNEDLFLKTMQDYQQVNKGVLTDRSAENKINKLMPTDDYVPDTGNTIPDNVNSLDELAEHSKTFLSRASKAGKYIFPPLAVAAGVLSTHDAYAEDARAKKYYSDTDQEMPLGEKAYLETSKFTAPFLGAAALPIKDIKDMGLGLKGIGERDPVAEKMIRRSGTRGRNKYQKRLIARQNALRENPTSFVQQPEPSIDVDESGFEAEYEGFALPSNEQD
tara:strand:- start:5 stop:2200 length:2196 start_codon:yes stop_codon:yes gene_type:complete